MIIKVHFLNLSFLHSLMAQVVDNFPRGREENVYTDTDSQYHGASDLRPLLLTWFSFNLNILRPRQNGRHFADDTFKRIFMNENVRISINISLKVIPKGLINNIPALVQIIAWRRPGDKPLSEPMMVSLLTHICVTRPQWINMHQYLHPF